MRGYYGVAVYHPKKSVNIGTLFRSANILGAKFIATIGSRYQKQSADTLATPRHVPLFEFDDFEKFYDSLPRGCRLIGVELADDAKLVERFSHPQQAVYLLGAEDHGLPPKVLSRCHDIIRLRGDRSLNVSVAGSIVLYERTREAQ